MRLAREAGERWRRSTPRVLFALPAAVLLLVLGCGGESTSSSPSASPTIRAVSVGEVRAALTAACAAVRYRDDASWHDALPGTESTRGSLENLYRHLAPLRWDALSAQVDAVPGRPGTVDVRFAGSFGAGPPDRVVVHVVLRFSRLRAWATVSADITPERLARFGLLTYVEPRRLAGSGCVVVYESEWRRLARLIPAARASVADLYGVRVGRPVTVYLYSSRAQATDAIGLSPDGVDQRIRFFSRSGDRLSSQEWSPADVGVVAPEVARVGAWVSTMLVHELSHAFTFAWFRGLAHRPDFFTEGLAVAAEEGRDFAALQRDVSSGRLSIPLLEAIRVDEIWADRSTRIVRLAYSEAGATVRFVRERWGVPRLRAWIRGVSDSDLEDASIRRATRRVLGVSWREFLAGWRAAVLAL